MGRKPSMPATVYKCYGPERTDVFGSFLVRFSSWPL